MIFKSVSQGLHRKNYNPTTISESKGQEGPPTSNIGDVGWGGGGLILQYNQDHQYISHTEPYH